MEICQSNSIKRARLRVLLVKDCVASLATKALEESTRSSCYPAKRTRPGQIPTKGTHQTSSFQQKFTPLSVIKHKIFHLNIGSTVQNILLFHRHIKPSTLFRATIETKGLKDTNPAYEKFNDYKDRQNKHFNLLSLHFKWRLPLKNPSSKYKALI